MPPVGRYGIDATAHLGALEASGTTIAVLACGADMAHPAGAGRAARHDRRRRRGGQRDAARLPRQTGPFLTRNRVITALAAGTVVVEASSRSGSMNTARYARGTGRPVIAVPGPVTSDCSAGCNEFIRRGQAALVTIPRDGVDT
jgi:DNA processing protein